MKWRVATRATCLLALVAGWGYPGWASDLLVTGDVLLWHSPNLAALPPREERDPASVQGNIGGAAPLGDLAYDRYFESHGMPPPVDFLTPLAAPPAEVAHLDRGTVVFPKTGARVTLGKVALPPGSSPASPSLLAGPGRDWVLVVHPYYLVQGKETHHVVEVYSTDGARRGSFDSLPTHASRDPQLLVSPDRLGCCDSLRWSVRFYDLRQLSVSEYACPESRCGDVVFTTLGSGGPFLIVQEIVEKVRDVGSVAETRIYLVDGTGALAGAGSLIHGLRDSPNRLQSSDLECALPTSISAQSPFAVRYLVSADPLPGEGGWVLRFSGTHGSSAWKLTSVWNAPSPSVVFDPGRAPVGR